MMELQFTPFILPVIAALLICIWLTIYAWQNRTVAGAAVFGLMTGSVAFWLFCYSLQLASVSLEARVFWIKLKYIGVANLPMIWTVFALQYTGRERWLTRRNLALMAVVPVVMLLLVFTNDSHHLVWVRHWLEDGLDVTTHGPYFWVFVVYNYLLLLFGTVLFLLMYVRAPRLYRRQIGWVLVGTAAPWIANGLTIFDLLPVRGLDLTALAFTITGVVIGWSLFREKFLDIVPVAYEAIVKNMNDGVIVLDVQNRIVAFNPAAHRITGLSPSDVVGLPAGQALANWPDLVEQYRDVNEARAEIALGEGESRRHFDLRITPLHDRRGRLTGRLVALHDITGRVRAAAERDRLITELDAFAHTVAHDLKNPLGVTIGYANLLVNQADTMDAEHVRQSLRLIERNGRKMQNIIDELLLLSSVRKLDRVQARPLDMQQVVAGAQERLLRLVEDSQAEIVLPGEWPVALGYAPWVEEVWANYLSNAIKYGGEPPRVEAGATIEDERVRFWVRDNGRGIAPEDQKTLFTQFTRLDETRVEGYGLGLSIVKRIVDRLGGEVGVESAVGQGSAFSFTLPRAGAVSDSGSKPGSQERSV